MKNEQTWAFYIKFRYSKIYFRSFKTNQEHKCPELEHRMLFYSAPSQHTSGLATELSRLGIPTVRYRVL